MPYRIVEIDVERPLPTLTLRSGEDGMAFIVRAGRRPVAFWLEPLTPGTQLEPATLSERISQHAGTRLLELRLERELPEPPLGAALPSLTIAVCTKDRPQRLARCLQSLAQLAHARAPQLLVVDNAPTDTKTREVVERTGGVRYVCEPRPGLDFARNRALREAGTDWLAFMDDDVVADPEWLSGFHAAVRANPDAAAITGLVLPYSLERPAQVLFEQAGGFRRGFRRLRYAGQDRLHDPLYPCAAGRFGAGANMALRRDVLLALGGFDEALDTGAPLPGGGDLDIFYRVLRAGGPLVYEPRCLVFHEHRRELAELTRQYWSWGLGFMVFVQKTARHDPAQRPRLRQMVAWWLQNHAQQLIKSVSGRHVLPPALVWAELRGGIEGYFGGYQRSERHVDQIRRLHQRRARPGSSAAAQAAWAAP